MGKFFLLDIDYKKNTVANVLLDIIHATFDRKIVLISVNNLLYVPVGSLFFSNNFLKVISVAFQTPERASKFYVDLIKIVSGNQARIDSQFSSAVINVLESDYPNGTIAFHKDAV